MSTTPPEPAAAPRRRLGDFQRLFTASTISNLGDGMGQIAYPWLASAVTRNPLLIALIVAFTAQWIVGYLFKYSIRLAPTLLGIYFGYYFAIYIIIAINGLGGVFDSAAKATHDTIDPLMSYVYQAFGCFVGGLLVGLLADAAGDRLAVGVFGAIPTLLLTGLLVFGWRTLAQMKPLDSASSL